MTTKTFDDETGDEIKGLDGVEVSALFEGDSAHQVFHFATWAGAAGLIEAGLWGGKKLLLATVRDRTVQVRNDPRVRPAPASVRP